MLLFDECLKLPGQYQVPQVLTSYKHPVLVIDDLFRLAPEIFESEFMGINRKLRVKRTAAEMDKLITGARQYDGEKVYLRVPAVPLRYPLLPEIDLGVLPIGGARATFRNPAVSGLQTFS